jgi:hypothetical protein
MISWLPPQLKCVHDIAIIAHNPAVTSHISTVLDSGDPVLALFIKLFSKTTLSLVDL